MSIGIHNLKPAVGSTHKRKRVGRGIGSGHGKTSTRGHKGNKSRGQINPNFEGGQTPLHRRLPMLRGVQHRNPNGFTKIRDRSYAILNLETLEETFNAGEVVTVDALVEQGLLRAGDYGTRPNQKRVKILGDGELTKKLTVQVHAFSKSAIEKIEAAGGAAEAVTSEG